MKSLLRLSQRSFAALVLATASAQAVVTITLDDFRDTLPPGLPQGDLVVNSLDPMASSTQMLTVPSVAGGYRTISLDYVSGPSNASVSTLIAPGRLSFSGGPGGFGGTPGTVATLLADYDLVAPIDFTAGGGYTFLIDIFSRDPAVAAEIVMSVASGAGTSMASVPFTQSGTTQSVPFTAFAGVDFTDVTGYSITINPEPAFDGSIRLIGVWSAGVPEASGSVALLAILAGVVARRRRS